MNDSTWIESSAETRMAERSRLLLALYEGALSFLRHATAACQQQDLERFAHFSA